MTSLVSSINGQSNSTHAVGKFNIWRGALLIQRNVILAIFAMTLLLSAFIIAFLPDLSLVSIQTLTSQNLENYQIPAPLSNALNRRTTVQSSVLIYLPLFYGVFFGASLFSRGADSGSNKFTWTQGIGRSKISSAQLIVVLVPIALSAFILATLYQKIWNQDLIRAGLFIYPGYFPFLNWDLSEFMLQPAIFTMLTVTFFMVAVIIGTLSRRVIIAMGLSFLIIFSGLLVFNTIYDKARNMVANQMITNDPMYRLAQTDAALIKAGLKTTNASASIESYSLGSGFLGADGKFLPIQQDTFAKFSKPVDGNSDMIEALPDAEYQALVKNLNPPFAIRWLAKEDFPRFVQSFSLGLAGLALLLAGINQMLIKRR